MPCTGTLIFALPRLVILLIGLWVIPVARSQDIQGRCVPTPPCYCNDECFRCGPGGCKKSARDHTPSKPQAADTADLEIQRQHDEALALNEQGTRYYNGKEWELAVDFFKRALRLWPDNRTISGNLEKARIALAQEEQVKQEGFARNKGEILRSLKGDSKSGAQLKGGDVDNQRLKGIDTGAALKNPAGEELACLQDETLSEYHEREQERKSTIRTLSNYRTENASVKARADWCKLHIPLPPSTSSADFCVKKPAYEARMVEWRRKCLVILADPAVPAVKKTYKPGIAPDCLGVYDGEAKSCETNDLLILSGCINKAITSFHHCLKYDEPGNAVPVSKP